MKKCMFFSRRNFNQVLSRVQKSTLQETEGIFDKLTEKFQPDKLQKRHKELEEIIRNEEFYKQSADYRLESLKESSDIAGVLEKLTQWKQELNDYKELMKMAKLEKDEEIQEEMDEMLDSLYKALKEEEFATVMMKEEDNRCDAFLEIQPGAGGTESADWASILKNMYIKWAENHGYQCTIQSETEGAEAGIRFVCLRIQGEYAMGWLRHEEGVHRLIRISPFDANNRRHTSFAAVNVFPDKSNDQKVVEIPKSDLKIEFMKGSGPGGQSVNKTESGCRVTHIPTGLTVRCTTTRNQHQNREIALNLLKSKLDDLERKQKEQDASSKELTQIAFGQQIRSYVLHPNQFVKDNRIETKSNNVQEILDGGLELKRIMSEILMKEA